VSSKQGYNGAGEEARTLDFHLGRVALYQLSYARKNNEIMVARDGFEPSKADAGRFTVCSLWPLGNHAIIPHQGKRWSCSQESNLRPTVYKTVALPTELEQPITSIKIDESEIYNGAALRIQAFLSQTPKHFSIAIAAADATFNDLI
jgi:hypothetical protein